MDKRDLSDRQLRIYRQKRNRHNNMMIVIALVVIVASLFVGGFKFVGQYHAQPVLLQTKASAVTHHVSKSKEHVVVAHVKKVSHDDIYVVQSGDSLWRIAEKVYGNGSKWKEIYQNNKALLKGSHGGRLIHIGLKLHLKGGEKHV